MFRSQLEAGNSINGHPLVMLKLNFDISNTVILR
jgi:hypothetical protein